MSDPVTPLTPEQTAAQETKAGQESYLRRLPVDLDIATDELLEGPMDMTISTRLGIAAMKGKWWGKIGCRLLNLFQKNHDAKAAAGDLERAAQVTQQIQQSGIAQLSVATPEEDEALAQKSTGGDIQSPPK